MPDTRTRLGIAWEEQLPKGWKIHLADTWSSERFRDLAVFLDTEYAHHEVLPDASLIFNAFRLTPFDDVRVVILGQDPYPNPLFPQGLSFSVLPGVRVPLSLQNIFRELSDDLGVPPRRTGSLIDWAQQGVLLMNTCLTVRSGHPGSHARKGWEEFTDRVLRLLSAKRSHLVFILWGSHAIGKAELIDQSHHLVLRSSHPTFMSANNPCGGFPPFLRSKPFSQTNTYLASHDHPEIRWTDTA